jgi:RHS repeat-associated protein
MTVKKPVNQRMFRGVFFSLLFAVLLILPVCAASAQTTLDTDGSTPLALSSGAPQGSYALSGFENVNLYNGSLNFSLPLLSIGGRGGASYPITLRIEHKWIVQKEFGPPNHYYPKAGWWTEENGWLPQYSIGRLDIRQGGSKDYFICSGAGYLHNQTLTRLTFTAPDGTEYDLRDQLTNGQPNHPSSCTGYNRGKIFVTFDGTSATFIADTDVVDYVYDDPPNVPPSGYMMLKDGTRYRIDNGRVSWMRDRNGNKLTFSYDNVYHNLTSVTDSLNRQVTITYGSTSVPYDLISYKGWGGASRSIKVYSSSLSDALRSDFPTVQNENILFPQSQLNGSQSQPVNPTVVKAVELPNGQQYQFQYNSYAELARVVLPTGGAFEYDYTAGITDGFASGVLTSGGDKHVYRRVIERREYPDGGTGSAFSTRATFSRPESSTANAGYVISDTYDSAGTLLGRSYHYFYGSAAASFNQQPTQYPSYLDGREYQTDVYDTDGATVLRRVENLFDQDAVSWWTGSSTAAPPNNTHLTETKTTIEPGGANLVTKQTFAYDQFNNQTDVYEYDYGQGAAPSTWTRHTHIDYLTTNNGADYASASPTVSSIHIRNLPTQQSVYDSNGAEKARTTFEYDNYSGANHAAIVSRSAISGLDSAFTSTYLYRGNVTAVSHWLLGQPNIAFTTYHQYDVAGNLVKAIDARGYASTIDYDDNYGAPNDEARTNTSPPELSNASQKSYAFPTVVTNALGHTSYVQFDYYLGKPIEAEDINGVVSSGYYDDQLDRPTQMVQAVNQDATVKSQTTFSYDDTNRVVTTTSDLATYQDNSLKGQVVYDKLGRVVKKVQFEPTTTVTVETIYDSLGRVKQVSNPYSTGDTLLWTVSGYDALGRVVSVQTPDGAIVTTTYTSNQMTVTDQAGKTMSSVTDALGRLTSVTEDPNRAGYTGLNYQTGYEYDVLGNLTKVLQGGQTRAFIYDSLSRLRSATNPESGTISYEYDASDNLIQKTDARSVVTTYIYDALDRVTNKIYSNATPEVIYTYDASGVAFSKGRLASVSSSISTTSYTGYNAMGRVTASLQVTDNQPYVMSYGYNLAGMLTSETYPSGRVVRTSYDSAGRISQLSGQKSGEADKTYASSFAYTAHGAVKEVKLGNNLWEHTLFNSRLQPYEIGLGTASTNSSVLQLAYTYNTANTNDNNGNVQTQTVTTPDLTLKQTYTYDSLNRLKNAIETNTSTQAQSWKQTFIYDRYGNRTFDAATGQTTFPNPLVNPSINENNNQINVAGYHYDSAGNLDTAPGYTYIYDAESHMVSSSDSQSTTGYGYDGDGRRVKKVRGTGVDAPKTVYVYDAMGVMVAEYDSAGPQQASATSYLTSDTLGTPRVITDSNGNVKARHDYAPFGEELGYDAALNLRSPQQGYNGDDVKQKFTQKERDAETGLDYFGARYYTSLQGRFTQADPLYLEMARLTDPQQLNLFSYVRNNPLKFSDPTGLDIAVEGDASADYINRLQDDVSFKVHLNTKTNKVEIIDANGNALDKNQLKALAKTLHGKDKEFFKAITDTKHHVTINAIQKGNSSVTFGSSDAPHKGHHTIAFDQANLLDAPGNAGGMTSAQLAGHETLEGYYESKGKSYKKAHKAANLFFPGLDPNGNGSPGAMTATDLLSIDLEFTVHGTNVTEVIEFKFDTPIPIQSIKNGTAKKTPAVPVNVRKKTP